MPWVALSDGLVPRAYLQGDDADLLVELGYQLSLSGTYDSAMEAYQAGARANEGDVRAMTGVVYCQVRYSGAPQNSNPRILSSQKCVTCAVDALL